jgi:hypothetical protein
LPRLAADAQDIGHTASVGVQEGDCGFFLHGAVTCGEVRKRIPLLNFFLRNGENSARNGDITRPFLIASAHMPNLLARIDKALSTAGKSRSELADHLGVSRQSFTAMRKRPDASMAGDKLALAADYLGVDLRWLCTGQGSPRPHGRGGSTEYGAIANQAAQMIDAMGEAEQVQILVMLARMSPEFSPK